MIRACWIAVLALILSVPMAAQQCHSLSGRWRMDPTGSFFAGLKLPSQQAENETLTITQAGGSIQEEWTFAGTAINGNTSYSFVPDGSEQKIARSGDSEQVPVSVRAEWQNCTLIVHKKMVAHGSLLLEFKNTYVLSEKGERLTIFQEAQHAFIDCERRLVFYRQ